MKKNVILAVFGFVAFVSLFWVLGQSVGHTTTTSIIENNINASINADTDAGVTTSMNGNTATKSGAPISSTAASSESRSASGSGE